MHIRTLPVLTLSLAFCVSAFAAPPGKGTNPVKPGTEPGTAVKILTELAMTNASGAPGDTRTFEATLTSRIGNTPVAGKKIVFAIEGKSGTSVPGGKINAGSATTDASGKARASLALPELAQGNYALKASFAGDNQATGSEGLGNLLMVKTITRIELSDLRWGTYKGEPGPPSGSFSIKVARTSDNQALAKPVTVNVNSKAWTLAANALHTVPLPSDATTWNVKVQFEGDAANAASAAQKTFSKPN
jgi:hypothetical protein